MSVGLGIDSIERLAWAFGDTHSKLLIPTVLKLWEFYLLDFIFENLVLFCLVLGGGINFLPLSSNIFLVIPLPLLFRFRSPPYSLTYTLCGFLSRFLRHS
jgi:hypothetical protein